MSLEARFQKRFEPPPPASPFTGGRWRVFVVRGIIMLTVLVAVAVGVTGVLTWSYVSKVSAALPPVEKLANYEPVIPSVVLSRDGKKIGEIFTEKRYPLSFKEMSPLLVDAFVSAEDARFFEHNGVDYQGVARAGLHYVLKTGSRQGGSTITQQLAKNLLLTRERTVERKLKDMLLAMRIEKVLEKEKILELYLNTIFLGNNSYGVEAAARNYFRKGNRDLSLAEASLIAGLAPAPSAYSPLESMQKAKTRQKFVLEQMVKSKKITSAQANAAFAEPLKIHRAESPNAKAAPYFFMEVKKQVEALIPSEKLTTEGYRVHTTLDLGLQRAAQKAVSESLAEYDSRKSFKGPIKRHGEKFPEALKKLVNEARGDDEGERAIVVEVFPRLGAMAVVSQSGIGLLLEEDHRWAIATQATFEDENAKFASILRVGDEIHVQELERRTPKRIGASQAKLQELSKYLSIFENAPQSDSIRFFELTDVDGMEGAALVANAENGEVLAVVGGRSFSTSQFNRATQAKRQVGSSVKPLYYSYALDQGFSAASLLDSPPIVIGDWRPENYTKELNGRTTLRRSLINSFNIPSIQLAQALGLGNCAQHFSRLGLPWDEKDFGFSLALGAGHATLLELVQSYTPFANAGRIAELHYVTRIEDRKGNVLWSAEKKSKELLVAPVAQKAPSKKASARTALAAKTSAWEYDPRDPLQVLSPQAAYISVRMMQDVIRFGTGTKAAGASPEAAGKTGTTNNYTDAWFLGVVPGYAAGVWVGFDDANRSLGNGATGGKMAAPIWRSIVAELTAQDKRKWQEPDRIRWVHVDPDSGQPLPGGGIAVPVTEGAEPGTPGVRHALGVLGLDGNDANGATSDTADDASLLRSGF